MVRYYELVPVGALRHEFDGHAYALVDHLVCADGVIPGDAARLCRADHSLTRDGIARVYIGAMGDAIAQTTNLPNCIEFVGGF